MPLFRSPCFISIQVIGPGPVCNRVFVNSFRIDDHNRLTVINWAEWIHQVIWITPEITETKPRTSCCIQNQFHNSCHTYGLPQLLKASWLFQVGLFQYISHHQKPPTLAGRFHPQIAVTHVCILICIFLVLISGSSFVST